MRTSISEISKMLSAQAENVCRLLLPHGKRHGKQWEAGGIEGNAGKSLKVNLDGENAGKWRDWADVGHGDLLDLWAEAQGIAAPEALRRAKEWLGVRELTREAKAYQKPRGEHPELAEAGAAMTYLTQVRKLEPKIINLYRVTGDPKHRAIAFPCYSPSGELLNHSYRGLKLDEKGKKKVWQDAGCAPSIWGWQSLTKADWESRELLICEGQIDAMTWRQWGFNAVSIPNGTGQSWIEYEWDNLEAFTTIFLSFDQDGKSAENLKGVISRLGKHRCRIVIIDGKDANDLLVAGRTAQDAQRWIQNADYEAMPHIRSVEYFADKVCDRFFKRDAALDGLAAPCTEHSKDPRKSFRFRDGEMTLWTGTSGHGKSTLLNLTALYLGIKKKKPCFIVSLETSPPEAIYRQMKGAFFAHDNEAIVRASLKRLADFAIYYDRIGHVGKKELFDVMAYVHARYGVSNIVIDSMMRIDGLEEDYPAQSALMVELVTFARETGIHIHLVAHPRKSVGDDSPKGQDISGSGNIRNNTDNILSLWRNLEKERKREDGEDIEGMADAVLTVEKDRFDGGFRKFPLSYDPIQFHYSPHQGEYKPNNAPKKKQYNSQKTNQ